MVCGAASPAAPGQRPHQSPRRSQQQAPDFLDRGHGGHGFSSSMAPRPRSSSTSSSSPNLLHYGYPPPLHHLCTRLRRAAGVQSETDFLAWGWRVPFILSVTLAVIGWWIALGRRKPHLRKGDAAIPGPRDEGRGIVCDPLRRVNRRSSREGPRGADFEGGGPPTFSPGHWVSSSRARRAVEFEGI